MDKRLTVSDVMRVYNVSRQTASRYMRQMVHMEHPLRVTETAIRAWEDSRTVYPVVATRSIRASRGATAMIPYRKEV